jgi:MFS family permease
MTQVTVQRTGVWANRNFRRLWLASTVSSFGSEVAELALPLLALITLSASAAEVGLVRVAQFLPFLLATLPLGLVVDRRRRQRRSLMVGADLGRFALVAAIPVTVWIGVARIELLYVIVFLAGILTVLYQVADFAFLPSVVDRNQLVDANGKISASQSANEIGGRGFGGLLIQAISAPVAVAVNAVAFLASALSLRRIKTDELNDVADAEAAVSGPAWREIVEGLRVAVRDRYVRALLGEATTFNVFSEMFILGLLIYTVRDLGMGPAAIGLVFTAGGVGSFVGAWFGARVTGRFGYGRVLLVTLIFGNAAPLGVVLTGGAGDATLLLLCSIFVIMGVGIGVANVHAVSLRQTAVPEVIRGRVNAAYRLISWGAIPLGAAAGGLLASVAGGQVAMITGAAGMSLATLWVAFSAVPRLRTIDDATAVGRR